MGLLQSGLLVPQRHWMSADGGGRCPTAVCGLLKVVDRAVRTRKKKTFVTPTEKNVHGDALCYIVMGPFVLQRLAVGGWRLVAVGGWRLAVGGSWRLAAVVPGGCP